MARTVQDTALLQNTIAGPHPLDIASLRPKKTVPLNIKGNLKGVKIGWSADLEIFEVHPIIRQNLMRSIHILEDMGEELEEIKLPWTIQMFDACMDYLTHIFGISIQDIIKDKGDLATSYSLEWASNAKKSTPKKIFGST